MPTVTELNLHPALAEYVDDARLNPMVISIRAYEQVRKGLHLPARVLSEPIAIASVGEGLTDFARIAHDRFGANIKAIDPIYSVIDDDDDTVANAINQIESVFGRRVDIRNFADVPSREIKLPHAEQRIPNSAYNLDLPDGSVDLVVSHRLVEHIDFSRALPEFFRILSPHGEIRMGETALLAFPEEEQLSLEYQEEGDEGPEMVPALGKMERAFGWLSEQEGLTSYVILDQSETPSSYSGVTLVIRNDDLLPEVNTVPLVGRPYATHHGRLMSLDPKVRNPRYSRPYCPITSIMR